MDAKAGKPEIIGHHRFDLFALVIKIFFGEAERLGSSFFVNDKQAYRAIVEKPRVKEL
jgi:hypothetical protein